MLPRSSLQLLQPKVTSGSAHVGCTDECEVAGISVSCTRGVCLHYKAMHQQDDPEVGCLHRFWTCPPRTCFHLCTQSDCPSAVALFAFTGECGMAQIEGALACLLLIASEVSSLPADTEQIERPEQG
jgi:hypothetical protein